MFTAKNLTEKFYHPELTAKTVETKSKRDFMPLPGVSGARCIKSPLPPYTKGGMNTATLNKGGGTIMPEGLSKTTLTRLRHPLPEVEGKEFEKDIKLACHPELVSGSQAGFTHRTSPLTKRKAAFTLAEVLITLGIIGVVAAMTLPALIQNHANSVVATRMAKFYSSINQAIRRAEVDYGDRIYWFEEAGIGNSGGDADARLNWFKKYLLPYMNGVTYKYYEKIPIFYMPDGSAFASINGADINRDWLFWTTDPLTKCKKWNGANGYDDIGVCAFAFYYSPDNIASKHRTYGIEPWKVNWTENVEDLYTNCKNSTLTYNRQCAAIIQLNGWKIPDDYPFKVSY